MNVNIYYIKDYQIFIPLAGQKNKPNSNPILSAVGGFRKAKMNLKSLAKKSGHTRFCSWSDLKLQLWESSSSINNQTLIYESKGETSVNHEKILDYINVPLPFSNNLGSRYDSTELAEVRNRI
jgi:hypothetical protein